MTRSKALILFGLPLLLVAGYALFLLCLNQPGFNGSRVKNPDAYLLDIRRMNGTDQHSLTLEQGDCLQIRFETEKGSLTMEITGPDGSEVYSGNGQETTDFTVTVPESGLYTITVYARQAKGSISVLAPGGKG